VVLKLKIAADFVNSLKRGGEHALIRKHESFDIDTALLGNLKLFNVGNDLKLYEVAETSLIKYLDEQK
jgi:hypothetical protein